MLILRRSWSSGLSLERQSLLVSRWRATRQLAGGAPTSQKARIDREKAQLVNRIRLLILNREALLGSDGSKEEKPRDPRINAVARQADSGSTRRRGDTSNDLKET